MCSPDISANGRRDWPSQPRKQGTRERSTSARALQVVWRLASPDLTSGNRILLFAFLGLVANLKKVLEKNGENAAAARFQEDRQSI